MDLRKLKTMIELVQQSGIAELEVTEGEEKVRIVRAHGHAPPSESTYTVAPPVNLAAGVATGPQPTLTTGEPAAVINSVVGPFVV